MGDIEDVIKELTNNGLTAAEKVVRTTEITWNDSPWKDKEKTRVASINQDGKFAKFYFPYAQCFNDFDELKPLIDYLLTNGYKTNLD